MKEIVSVIDTNSYEIESELVFEHYAQLLFESGIEVLNLLILRTRKIKVSTLERMKEIFYNHEETLNYYFCDVFDASTSFYKAAFNRRVTTCNGSQYVFVDLLMNHNKTNSCIPIWKKVLLTVEESTQYFGIGRNKNLELTNDENCAYVLFNGSKRLIKHEAFEKYLMEQYSICDIVQVEYEYK